ncbi:hypothetical protein ACFQJD_02620 [Haloplanus sp. GCM10025708]|uniref:hypothetical protein n=1 Tax=Haloplanus sp. GCM10025708 TaxID=3252679 RepID=UPI003615ABE1
MTNGVAARAAVRSLRTGDDERPVVPSGDEARWRDSRRRSRRRAIRVAATPDGDEVGESPGRAERVLAVVAGESPVETGEVVVQAAVVADADARLEIGVRKRRLARRIRPGEDGEDAYPRRVGERLEVRFGGRGVVGHSAR